MAALGIKDMEKVNPSSDRPESLQRKSGVRVKLFIIIWIVCLVSPHAISTTQEAVKECALALAPEGGWRPPLTEADQTLFRMIREFSNADLVMIHNTTSWTKFTDAVANVVPGGILFVRGDFGEIMEYFWGRPFEYFPFMWRNYHIYRREGSSA